MAEQPYAYDPDYAIAPGETIRETLTALGMTQAELADRMGRPKKTINELVNGKAAIIPETAVQLERVLGIPAQMWLNLEANYQATKAKTAHMEQLEQGIERVKDFPYTEMAKLGWVPSTRKAVEKVENLLSFLGVASFAALDREPAAAYRVAQCKEASGCALAAWLRRGELVAQHIETEHFNKRKVTKAIPLFRDMTNWPAARFQDRLKALCASCGVALVMVPHLKRTYVHGATQWLTATKAVVQLTIRCGWADIFWFSFFHEIGHLLLHDKRNQIFVNFGERQSTDEETEADEFAANTLIPPHDFERIRQAGQFTPRAVRAAAEELGIAPGVLVGRLQHEKLLTHIQMNFLRERFTWANED